jgi:hypothetical protein
VIGQASPNLAGPFVPLTTLAILQASLSFLVKAQWHCPVQFAMSLFRLPCATIIRGLGSTIRPHSQGQATNDGERRKLVATTVLTAQIIKLSVKCSSFWVKILACGESDFTDATARTASEFECYWRRVSCVGITGNDKLFSLVHMEGTD